MIPEGWTTYSSRNFSIVESTRTRGITTANNAFMGKYRSNLLWRRRFGIMNSRRIQLRMGYSSHCPVRFTQERCHHRKKGHFLAVFHLRGFLEVQLGVLRVKEYLLAKYSVPQIGCDLQWYQKCNWKRLNQNWNEVRKRATEMAKRKQRADGRTRLFKHDSGQANFIMSAKGAVVNRGL